jgi:hypothetical protein
MRNKGKMVGWGVALAAAAAMITTGTVYAGAGQQVASSSGPSSEQLRSVLVSLAEQPESRFVRGPMTLKDAAALNAFASPSSMVFSPKSCATYLEDALGPLDSLDGWIQFGSRVNPTHNDNFVQAVVNIPGGADLKAIQAAVSTCKTGTLTLEGQATGDITYTERAAPQLAGAQTYAVTGRTKFNYEAGSAEAELVRRYEMPPDAQLLVNTESECVAETTFVATGDTLIVVMEADLAFANEIATAMHANLQGLQN